MSSEYSFDVNWQEEYENYDNVGRNALFNSCKHKNSSDNGHCDEGKCDFSEDSAEPMMNYAYPLRHEPSEQEILKVVKNTNCTVMRNNETEEYCLVLCGGGMDLSQDIALAYIYAQGWIPHSLIQEVSTQYGLSVSGRGDKKCKTKTKRME